MPRLGGPRRARRPRPAPSDAPATSRRPRRARRSPPPIQIQTTSGFTNRCKRHRARSGVGGEQRDVQVLGQRGAHRRAWRSPSASSGSRAARCGACPCVRTGIADLGARLDDARVARPAARPRRPLVGDRVRHRCSADSPGARVTVRSIGQARRDRDRHRHDQHAEVDGVPAVPAPVARGEAPGRRGGVLAARLASRARAPRTTSSSMTVATPAASASVAERHRARAGRATKADDRHHDRHEQRDGEALADGRPRGRAPWQRRADAHQEQQRDEDRHRHAVEPRRADADRVAARGRHQHREERAEQDREGQRQEEDVVEQERRLAADGAGGAAAADELRQPPDQERRARRSAPARCRPGTTGRSPTA